MRHLLTTFVLWLSLTSTLLAEKPIAIISGPNSAPAPGVIILNSLGSQHDIGDLYWIVADSNVQSMEGKDGRCALFWMKSKPVNTKILLITWGMVGNVPTPAMYEYPVAFGGDVPPTPDPPTPNPPGPTPPGPTPSPVAPVLPDGKFKLAKLAYNSGMLVPQAARVKAQPVASCYLAVSKKLAADSYPDILTSSGELKDLIAKTLSNSDLDSWTVFSTPVYKEVNRLRAISQINTMQDLSVAYSEIYTGLNQVK